MEIPKDIFSRGDIAALMALLSDRDRDEVEHAGFDVNARLHNTSTNNTPLILAAQDGRTKMVAYLLSLNADVNATNKRGHTALSALGSTHVSRRSELRKEHTKCLEVLLKHNADPNRNGVLSEVCSVGCLDCVRALIAHGASLNYHDAAFRISSPLMAILSSPLRLTPTYYPPIDRLSEALQLLLDEGADVSLKSSDGYSALMYAARFGYPLWVQALLDRGATVNEAEPSGSSVLHSVVRSHSDPNEQYRAVINAAQCVSMLIQQGANIDAVTQVGRTALMDAAIGGKFESVRLLVDHGASANIVDAEGRTALMAVVLYLTHNPQLRQEVASIVDLLLTHNATITLNTQTAIIGSTALMAAAGVGFHEIICRLIGAGADVHLRNNQGGTALHTLAYSSRHSEALVDAKCVDALVDARADINLQQARDGATPLMRACVRNQDCAIAKRLLQLGAKVDIRNDSNRTAMNIAIENFGSYYHIGEAVITAKQELIADLLFCSRELSCLPHHLRSTPEIKCVLQLLARMSYLSLLDGSDLDVPGVPAIQLIDVSTIAKAATATDHIVKYLFNEWIAREVCTFMDSM